MAENNTEVLKNYAKSYFTKNFGVIDEEQQIVSGYVTDGLIDLEGHIVDEMAFRSAIADYIQWANVRDQHGLPVGTVVGLPEWNKFEVKIVDDNVWKKIKAGIYKGFSIGALVLEAVREPIEKYTDEYFLGIPDALVNAIKSTGFVTRIKQLVLVEVSVVDRPANPRALITSYKFLSDKEENKYEYLPIPDNVLKALNKGVQIQGDQKMEELEKNVPVENVEANPTLDVAQTDLTTAEAVEVDFGAKFASLEKTVNDIVSENSQIKARLDEFNSTFSELQKSLTSISERLAANVQESISTEQEVIEEQVQEQVVEVEETEKNLQAIITKTLSDALGDFTAKIDEIKTIAEELKKAQVAELSVEREAGVNGGDSNDEVIEQPSNNKNVKKGAKVTYRDAALGVARVIGASLS